MAQSIEIFQRPTPAKLGDHQYGWVPTLKKLTHDDTHFLILTTYWDPHLEYLTHGDIHTFWYTQPTEVPILNILHMMTSTFSDTNDLLRSPSCNGEKKWSDMHACIDTSTCQLCKMGAIQSLKFEDYDISKMGESPSWKLIAWWCNAFLHTHSIHVPIFQ